MPKKAESPVVSGRKMTFATLGKLCKTTAANAAQKYYRIKKDHGKVTMVQMQSPYRSPVVEQRVATNMLEREKEELVRHARLHGPTHTAMVHQVDHDYVKRLVDNANRRIARMNSHD